MSGEIDENMRLLAAIAYGEASISNISEEIGAIAFAVANRCRAWNAKTITEMKAADPNYAYAWNGTNQRFNRLIKAGAEAIQKDPAMADALKWAKAAWDNEIADPSNGALFWDGLDFKIDTKGGDNKMHPKRQDGFKYGSPLHNIFNVPENRKEIIVRWKIRNRKTREILDGAERGRYDAVWISTAAHGKTILWKHPKDYLTATGGKEYR